jgi:SAM-dependent methyltransferase
MGNRTIEQLYEQYIVEKELAERLRRSDRDERKRLYSTLYDELFERVPHHPQLSRKDDPALRRKAIELQMNLLERFLMPDSTFVEIGCGDCLLSLEVAKRVGKAYGIDVARKISAIDALPHNFELMISDGTNVDVPPGSVDIVYSNQLLEHLHPADVTEHLQSVYRCLAAGGRYILSTPHRYAGPHDISRYFDNEARGLHLHEYTLGEIASVLRSVGFSGLFSYKRFGSHYTRVSCYPLMAIERCMEPLPPWVRRRVANFVFRTIRVMAGK